MRHSNQQAHLHSGPDRSVGAWLAYVLLLVVLAIAAFTIWLLLKACGVQLLGRTVVFSWCQAPSALSRSLTELEDRNRMLGEQIHDSQLALMSPEACGPVVSPVQDPMGPPNVADPPTPEQAEPVDEAAFQCQPNEVLQRPNEVAIVLDGSGSMKYSVDIPPDLERRYLDAWDAANNAGGGDFFSLLNNLALQERANSLDQQLRNYPGRNRMDVAREVLDDAVRRTPDAIQLDLTYFNSCTRITSNSYGVDRDGLRRAIARVSPDSGTPLARAMRIAAGNLQGGDTIDDPINMVVVTDGNDSCGGDPCAVARQLKRQKPGLTINVVDMSQSNSLSCVSDTTGGTYRRSRGVNPGELITAIEEAVGYSGEGQCRPAMSD